ncbi:MAG: ATP-dependent DNA helicase RecG [Acidobacteriaceae bacterium]
MLELGTEIQFVKGVGPRIAAQLQAKGIRVVEDLLLHLPFRYEDRENPRALIDLQPGEMASVIAEVRGTVLLKTRSMPIFEMTVGQGTTSMKCMWFHGTYLKDRFQAGQTVALFGKVEPSRSTKNFKMIQPQFEVLREGLEDAEDGLMEVGRITPVYESLGGSQLSSRWIRRVIFHVLKELEGRVPETLPRVLVERLELPSREEALRLVHFPASGTSMSALQGSATPAHRRLIFEELFYLELGLELKRRKFQERLGMGFVADERVRGALREILPFHPTRAQKRALGEIVGDMREARPMRRLLQGDVGSGKTIVALQAMVIAIENGYQAALMAPTEILATQHYLAARRLLEKSKKRYRVLLLTGSLDEDTKRANRGKIYRGEADLVIGTHALIEEKVEFQKLGLVVVDEQHRFGVMQRFRLMKKPNQAEPDVLAMTATPIPRTLALSLYGDLDLSVIDELPPGRKPIVTRQVPEERADEVWAFVRQQVAEGRQAYVVYPVIEGPKDDQPELDFAKEDEETADLSATRVPRSGRDDNSKKGRSGQPAAKAGVKAAGKTAAKKSSKAKKQTLFPKTPLRAATDMYESLRAGALAGLRLGLLHGRLSADDKDVVMRRFQRGEIDVLISTTVIEVGVDVPNASVMVVEHAERFGLAQLHQLRGRVGRGAAKSYCLLVTGGRISEQGAQRLDAMVRTQDGFELAELDLQLRGPGEFFGTRQAGLPDFRVANLLRDRELLELSKKVAAAFVKTPEGTEAERAVVRRRLQDAWQRRYGLSEA